MENYKKLYKPFLLWIIVTMFFAWQFIMRLFVGVINDDIYSKFNISTSEFGTFISIYYAGYAFMLIPLGFLLDRFNFRYVTAICIIVTSISSYIMNITDNWTLVVISRFFVGAGSAVGFLSVAKVTKTFFPNNMHSMLIGFSFTVGLVGAVFAGNPTKSFYDSYGYITTFNVISAVPILLALIVLSVSDRDVDRIEEKLGNEVTFSKTISLLFNHKILFVGFCGGLMVGSLEGFADRWGKSYFIQVLNYNMEDAISVIFTVYVGLCIGGPILSALSEIFNSKIFLILLTGILTTIIFIIIFNSNDISYSFAKVLMLFMGILCCYQVLIFTLATSLVDKAWAGMAIAIVNCLITLFGSFFHEIIPYLIQRFSSDEINAMANPVYTQEAYIKALGIIPITAMIGAIGFVYLSIIKKRGKLEKISL